MIAKTIEPPSKMTINAKVMYRNPGTGPVGSAKSFFSMNAFIESDETKISDRAN